MRNAKHREHGHSGHSGQLGSYLARIARYPVLDREQELELASRHVGGEHEAGELLVCAHLRDVVVIARGYLGYGQPLAELVAVGNLGLVRALGRFEPDRGLRFMTYAGYWVRAEMLEHVARHWGPVGVGRSSMQTRLFFGLARARSRGEALGLRGDELCEHVADHLGCSTARVLDMQQRLEHRDHQPDMIGELAGDDDLQRTLERAELADRLWIELDAALGQLGERERVIVERRLLAEHAPSLAELGGELGLSRERVRQLEGRARGQLRRRLEELGLG